MAFMSIEKTRRGSRSNFHSMAISYSPQTVSKAGNKSKEKINLYFTEFCLRKAKLKYGDKVSLEYDPVSRILRIAKSSSNNAWTLSKQINKTAKVCFGYNPNYNIPRVDLTAIDDVQYQKEVLFADLSKLKNGRKD